MLAPGEIAQQRGFRDAAEYLALGDKLHDFAGHFQQDLVDFLGFVEILLPWGAGVYANQEDLQADREIRRVAVGCASMDCAGCWIPGLLLRFAEGRLFRQFIRLRKATRQFQRHTAKIAEGLARKAAELVRRGGRGTKVPYQHDAVIFVDRDADGAGSFEPDRNVVLQLAAVIHGNGMSNHAKLWIKRQRIRRLGVPRGLEVRLRA